MEKPPRIDILLYAHDGRGLGHASRTIAIGLALRRLYPRLSILFLTGCKTSQELIAPGLLDWIKLPSYETKVIDGISQGTPGNTNIEDKELGGLREETILQIVKIYRPRIILADHSPQGKHRELLPALQETGSTDTKWVLGLRGVPGNLNRSRQELAASIFARHYRALLWYGDTEILGDDQMKDIAHQFEKMPLECGYVSRMTEIMQINKRQTNESDLAGVISIPWIGEMSPGFLLNMAAALKRIGPSHGHWHLFIDGEHPESNAMYQHFYDMDYCTVEKTGPAYLDALLRTKTAVIYGGYNSLMDVLSLSLPSLIIMRAMQDQEQQIHLHKLLKKTHHIFSILPESCTSDQLYTNLLSRLHNTRQKKQLPALNGSENAARHLYELLQKQL